MRNDTIFRIVGMACLFLAVLVISTPSAVALDRPTDGARGGLWGSSESTAHGGTSWTTWVLELEPIERLFDFWGADISPWGRDDEEESTTGTAAVTEPPPAPLIES